MSWSVGEISMHSARWRKKVSKKKKYTENKYEMYANGLWLDLLTLGSSLDSPALFCISSAPCGFFITHFWEATRPCRLLVSFFVAQLNGEQQKGQASAHPHPHTRIKEL